MWYGVISMLSEGCQRSWATFRTNVLMLSGISSRLQRRTSWISEHWVVSLGLDAWNKTKKEKGMNVKSNNNSWLNPYRKVYFCEIVAITQINWKFLLISSQFYQIRYVALVRVKEARVRCRSNNLISLNLLFLYVWDRKPDGRENAMLSQSKVL